MRDGTPNGYWLADFDGTDYQLTFRAARRPADYQMNIVAPHRLPVDAAAQIRVLANIFAGSPRTQVSMQVGDSEWIPMQREVMHDPRYAQLVARERRSPPSDRRALKGPAQSTHIWVAPLPPGLAVGSYVVTVRALDPYAGELLGRHILDVVDER
jgi:hypothetical protein